MRGISAASCQEHVCGKFWGAFLPLLELRACTKTRAAACRQRKPPAAAAGAEEEEEGGRCLGPLAFCLIRGRNSGGGGGGGGGGGVGIV